MADYYLQRAHFDLECKLTFGGRVTLYIYGQIDGDSRQFSALAVLLVKTARTRHREKKGATIVVIRRTRTR